MKINNKLIPNTNITLKQFKELLYNKFKAYPNMQTDYRNNRFIIANTFYENVSITQRKLSLFCNKLGIEYNKEYTSSYYTKCIVINLTK